MKDWDYSTLSHNASLHGGPEKYIELIKTYACQNTNKKWLKGLIPALLVLTPLAVKGTIDICQNIKKNLGKNMVTAEQAKEAEEKLTEKFHE